MPGIMGIFSSYWSIKKSERDYFYVGNEGVTEQQQWRQNNRGNYCTGFWNIAGIYWAFVGWWWNVLYTWQYICKDTDGLKGMVHVLGTKMVFFGAICINGDTN